MDKFTETYIEMVTKAKEIQDLCKYQEGDWFYFDEFDWEIMRDGDNRDWYKNNYKWLPTLEDLFGILNNQYPVGIFIIIKEFNVWLEDRTLRKAYKDLKDYFLDYIMEILYNKSWNGKEWEEINEM